MKNLLLPSLILLVFTCPPRPAAARPYSLDEMLALAHKGNPGLAAGAQATASIAAQLLEARRSYMPSGELNSTLAQAPKINCSQPEILDGNGNPTGYKFSGSSQDTCIQTNAVGYSPSNILSAITPAGVYTRTELKLVQPIYTFGKLSAGVAAAESGIKASQSREDGLWADLELNVRKAYWAAKLAREIVATLEEGSGYLDSAQEKIEKELAEGTGDARVTDRLRLRTMRADIDARLLEAKRGRDLALSGLRALIGPGAPADLDIDAEALTALSVPGRSLPQYEEEAQRSRPEVRALEYMVAAKRALADLETKKQYPDLFLVGTATYAYASSVDTPHNAFANDPFHVAGGAVAAGFRWPLDLGVRNAHAVRLRAEAEEAEQTRREAMTGITFDVEKATTELKEAESRMSTTKVGEKAGRQWVAAVAQNLAVGLAEARDFSDALLAFFQARIRLMQSIYDFNIAAAQLSRATGIDVTAARL